MSALTTERYRGGARVSDGNCSLTTVKGGDGLWEAYIGGAFADEVYVGTYRSRERAIRAGMLAAAGATSAICPAGAAQS